MSFIIKDELLERYTADGGTEEKPVVPFGVTTIAERAFYECPAEEVELPYGLTNIGNNAFANSRLVRAVLPDTVTEIGDGIFFGCGSLEYAEIPAGLDELKRDTFRSCSSMKICRIHEGVRKVQPTAFSQCRCCIEIVNREYRVTLPYISDWDLSSASKCLSILGQLGSEEADRMLGEIVIDEHKLALAVYCYGLYMSQAAADILSGRLYDAAVMMINDDDNSVMLERLLYFGAPGNFKALYSIAENAGAVKCMELLEPFAAVERDEAERFRAAAKEASRYTADNDYFAQAEAEEFALYMAEEEARARAAEEELERYIAEEEARNREVEEELARYRAADEEAARLKLEEEERLKAAEEAARLKAEEEARAKAAAEEAESAAKMWAVPSVYVDENGDIGFDFTPQADVFRRVTVDSELIYRLKSGLTLHNDPQNGFECRFDEESSSPILVIKVTDDEIMKEPLRSLLNRCFFGERLTLNSQTERHITEMDLKKEFSADPAQVMKMLLTETDIIAASEILDEWSLPVPDTAHARQAVPDGATHEHCIYRNGKLEYYELYSWNVRVAKYEDGTIKELCDGADCEWDSRSLERFIDSLPVLYRVERIEAKRPDRLRLPYTCYSVGADALKLGALKKLVICRKSISIGDGDILSGYSVVGIKDSAAQLIAEKNGADFECGFGVMRGAGRVFPVSDWSIEAPDESLWHGETDYMAPKLELVNCPQVAGGTLCITFIEEKLNGTAADELRKRFGRKIYHQLCRDDRHEIGLGIETYAFRMGGIEGMTAATYYINGCVAVGDSMTTMLTSYVGSAEGAAAAVGTVCGLMSTIEFADTHTVPTLTIPDTAQLTEKLQAAAEQAAVAANAPKRVKISDDWAITIPRSYVWTTDHDEIHGHRCLLILGGGEGSDVGSYHNATESYSCMSSQGPICSGDLREYCNKLRIRKLGLLSFGGGSAGADELFVLKHTSDIAVFVQLCENKGGNTVFRSEIITPKGVYPMQAVFSSEETLVAHENRLAELLMTVSDKDKPCTDTYMRCFFGLNDKLRNTKPANGETAKHYHDTRAAEDGFDNWLRMGIQLRDSIEYAMRSVEGVSAQTFGLSETAWKLADVFAVDDEHFDPKLDREQEIRHCYIRETEYMTTFRSFAWLIAEYCELNGCQTSDISGDVVLSLAQLVESRGCLCYDETHYSEICGVPDVNVLYIPDGEIVASVERLVKDGGWQSASLDKLREQLAALYPCMVLIRDYLAENRDSTRTLRGIHSDILYVWCSLTIAADGAFAVTTDAPVSCDFVRGENFDFADFVPQVLIEAEVSAAMTSERTEEQEQEKETGIRSIVSGERIQLDDYAEKPLVIEPGYTAESEDIELDGYAFMLNADGKCRTDDDFVFFGQSKSPCGTISLDDDNSCRFTLELSHAGDDVANILIVYAVYGDEPEQTLAQIHGMNIGFFSGGERVMEFIPDSFAASKAMAACEIYRHEDVWKVRAVGRGYKGSLEELCGEFGLDVE